MSDYSCRVPGGGVLGWRICRVFGGSIFGHGSGHSIRLGNAGQFVLCAQWNDDLGHGPVYYNYNGGDTD
jgi:hypothetical protein